MAEEAKVIQRRFRLSYPLVPKDSGSMPNAESGIRTPIPAAEPKLFGMAAEPVCGIRRTARSACSGMDVRHGPDYAIALEPRLFGDDRRFFFESFSL